MCYSGSSWARAVMEMRVEEARRLRSFRGGLRSAGREESFRPFKLIASLLSRLGQGMVALGRRLEQVGQPQPFA